MSLAQWCAAFLALGLPGVAAAQTQPTANMPTSLLPPSQQYPGTSIQSEPLAPPPGTSAPSFGTPQSPSVTTPASPQPPSVITPTVPGVAGTTAPPTSGTTVPPNVTTAPAPAAPAAPINPQLGATPGGTQIAPGTPQPAPGAPQAGPGQSPAAVMPPPPNPWVPKGGAVVLVLDKPDAQARTLTIKVGESATWRSLTIAVKACDIRPPDMVPNATAYLDITDSHRNQPGFSGWMLASDPSLNMMQNPVYNVQVKACTP